jgi:predicted RNA-binding Zn-ribbon protein involved in translation (DUF1610 family)
MTDDAETTVRCCPECGDVHIHRRTPKLWGTPDDAADYHCAACGADVDEVDRRPRYHNPGLNGLAKRLAEADPDDVGGEVP